MTNTTACRGNHARRRSRFASLLALCWLVVTLGGVPVANAADPSTPPTTDPTPPPDPGAGPVTELDSDPFLDEFGTAEATDVPPGLSPDCLESADPIAAADALMADQYAIGTWPVVTLPHDLTWAEDPYGDANWRYRFHTLRSLLDLVEAGAQTANAAYTDRALEIAADWLADNPRDGGASDMSWNDHSTALRATVLACLADRLPWPEWLDGALRLHGETLADPAFYVEHGNHALNQSVGLLEVGRVLGEQPWIDLAVARIGALVGESIDAEGVTNEQSVGYQLYNYRRYTVTAGRLAAVGAALPPEFERVARMPDLLAHATLPWGRYEMIGDTVDQAAEVIPGTPAEYTATMGASGPQPETLVRSFKAGYLFARSGWGTRRAFADETALSVRWGPPLLIHGHHDGMSLTLSSWQSRLLLDPGMYAYLGGPYRGYFRGRTAHNVVTVAGARWSATAPTQLVAARTAARFVDVRLRTTGYQGVVHDRRITWSRRLDYLVVEDRLRSTTRHTYRQLWHLPPDSRPVVGTRTARTRQQRGNVFLRQLTGSVTQRLVVGSTAPIQGWVSMTYGARDPAPVLEVSQRGTSVRFVTLIATAAGRPSPEVQAFVPTRYGYSLRVRIGTRVERVVVNGTSVSIATVGG
jgi:hypothetical protein